jgi:hypothetical protein
MSILDVKDLEIGLPRPILRLIDSYATIPQIKSAKHTKRDGKLYIEIGFEGKDTTPFLIPNPDFRISHMRLVPAWRCVVWRQCECSSSVETDYFCVYNPAENKQSKVRECYSSYYFVSNPRKRFKPPSVLTCVDGKTVETKDLELWNQAVVGQLGLNYPNYADCPRQRLWCIYSDWTLGQPPLPVLGVQQQLSS